MPTQLTSPRPRNLFLALTVCLAGALFAPAKPPDLPVPVKVEATPTDEPACPLTALDAILNETVRPATSSCPCGTFTEGVIRTLKRCRQMACDQEECEGSGRCMADRCAAMRTMTRCFLFGVHPFAGMVRLKPVCNFDDEAPYPVVKVGSVTISVKAVVHGTAVAVTSGPFCPMMWKSLPPVYKRETPVTGGCTYKPAAAKKPMPSVDVTNSVLEKLEQVERASQLYSQAEDMMHDGDLEKARKMYEEICTLVPGHRFADMASDRLNSLKGLTTGAEEQEKTPSKPVNPDGAKNSVRKVYQIADLLIDNTCKDEKESNARAHKNAEALIGCIKETIRPQCWQEKGGRCTIDYFPLGMAIVVRGDAAMHEQIMTLFEGLRYLADIRQLSCGQLLSDKNRDETQATLNDPCFREQHTNTTKAREEQDPCIRFRRHANMQKVAEEESEQLPAGEEPKLCCMGYDVSKLLATYEVSWDRETDELSVKTVHAKSADEIVRLICNGIAPKTWYVNGGAGTIEFNRELKTLFVRQTGDVHEAIADFLAAREKEIELRKENVHNVVKRQQSRLELTPVSRKKVVPTPHEDLKPHMPDVDDDTIRAYDAILHKSASRMTIKVHETGSDQRPSEPLRSIPRLYVGEEECDLELVMPATAFPLGWILDWAIEQARPENR